MDVALAGEITTAAVVAVLAAVTDFDTAWFKDLANRFSRKLECKRT